MLEREELMFTFSPQLIESNGGNKSLKSISSYCAMEAFQSDLLVVAAPVTSGF